jgi:hypothetical protein
MMIMKMTMPLLLLLTINPIIRGPPPSRRAPAPPRPPWRTWRWWWWWAPTTKAKGIIIIIIITIIHGPPRPAPKPPLTCSSPLPIADVAVVVVVGPTTKAKGIIIIITIIITNHHTCSSPPPMADVAVVVVVVVGPGPLPPDLRRDRSPFASPPPRPPLASWWHDTYTVVRTRES